MKQLSIILLVLATASENGLCAMSRFATFTPAARRAMSSFATTGRSAITPLLPKGQSISLQGSVLNRALVTKSQPQVFVQGQLPIGISLWQRALQMFKQNSTAITTAVAAGGLGAYALNRMGSAQAQEYAPEEIMPLYFKKFGILYNSEVSVKQNLKDVVSNPELLKEFGARFHEIPNISKCLAQENLIDTMANTIKKMEVDNIQIPLKDIQQLRQILSFARMEVMSNQQISKLNNDLLFAINDYESVGNKCIRDQKVLEALPTKLKGFVVELEENPGLGYALNLYYPSEGYKVLSELVSRLKKTDDNQELTDNTITRLLDVLNKEGVFRGNAYEELRGTPMCISEPEQTPKSVWQWLFGK